MVVDEEMQLVAALAALMGLLWFSGNIIYGLGMAKIGALGAVSADC